MDFHQKVERGKFPIREELMDKLLVRREELLVRKYKNI
jgi:hypothetical protein